MIIVENLNISFPGKHGFDPVVKDVSFALGKEKLALVGGSGSGKTLTAKALFGLVPKPGQVQAKTLSVFGHDILNLKPEALRKLRGKQMAMIMQDPKFSLNPVLTVGVQIAECFKFHQGINNKQAKEHALAILAEVKIKEPAKVYSQYAFQLSGGMGQRVMIAMMIACDPRLLVADEATSALDATTKHEILELLDAICKAKQMSLLMISHDLHLVATYCDKALVMHKGEIVDSCNANNLSASVQPYTAGLWNCKPSLEKKGLRLSELGLEINPC